MVAVTAAAMPSPATSTDMPTVKIARATPATAAAAMPASSQLILFAVSLPKDTVASWYWPVGAAMFWAPATTLSAPVLRVAKWSWICCRLAASSMPSNSPEMDEMLAAAPLRVSWLAKVFQVVCALLSFAASALGSFRNLLATSRMSLSKNSLTPPWSFESASPVFRD